MLTTNRHIHPQQMEAWIAKLQANMQTFREGENKNTQEQLIFIRQQYALLDTVVKVLQDKAYLVGCSHSKIP